MHNHTPACLRLRKNRAGRHLQEHRQAPGAVADLISPICSDGISALPSCFLGTGGSLLDTGLVATSPHLIARAKALDNCWEGTGCRSPGSGVVRGV